MQMVNKAWDVFPDIENKYSNAFHETLFYINANQPVGKQLAYESLLHVLHMENHSIRDATLGALLMGLNHVASEDTVAGLIRAVGDYEGIDLLTDKIRLNIKSGKHVVGVAGSGKKGVKTINISTASMIIASSIGTYCAKAGSRSTSSLTGSTDLLEKLGFKVHKNIEQNIAIFDKTKFGFFPIEHTIRKFDELYGGRFFAPHALSFALPATVLPVLVDSMFYGYAGPNIKLAASSLLQLGYKNVFVVNNTFDSIHYIDEMASTGITSVIGAVNGTMGRQKSFDGSEFMGITTQHKPDILETYSIKDQAEVIYNVLANALPNSIAENTICLNAGTLSYIAQDVSNPNDGFQKAKAAIKSGKALQQLNNIISVSQTL